MNSTQSVLDLNISPWNLLDALQRRSRFTVSSLLCFRKGILLYECEGFVEVQGIRSQQQGPFPASDVIWAGLFVICWPVGLSTALWVAARTRTTWLEELLSLHLGRPNAKISSLWSHWFHTVDLWRVCKFSSLFRAWSRSILCLIYFGVTWQRFQLLSLYSAEW
jgi:hypothetical protein